MKKLLIVALAAAALTSGAFAKSWTNNIGVGFTLPISTFGVKEDNIDDVKQTGYGVEGTYIGVHQNGFTAKADVSIGVATSKDIGLMDDDTDIGAFENIYVGAGWSFVNTEKALFGVTGMLGLNCSQYTVTKTQFGKDHDITCTLVSFGLGGDVFGLYRFQPNFGMFANVGIRYLVAGTARLEDESKNGSMTVNVKNDYDLSGKLSIQPTIGVIWTF